MSEINYTQFKKSISLKELSNLYLLTGDPDLIHHCGSKILSAALGKNYTAFDVITLKDESFSNEKLQLALDTFPISASKKCVVLKEVPWEYFSIEDFETFLKIISDVPSFSILVIAQISPVIGSKNSSRFSKVKRFIKKSGIYANLLLKDVPLEKQLITWAKKEYNKILKEPEAKKIISLCREYPLHELKNELKKVCEFESEDFITESSLKLIYSSKIKVNAFELSRALFDGNIKRCFEVLDGLFSQNEEPIRIVAALSADFIDLYRAIILIENGRNPSELINLFDYKKKEFRIKSAQYRSNKFSRKCVEQCLELLLEADFKLKSESFSFKAIISELLIKLYKKISSNVND